jgi:hypothetical protein
LDNLQVLQIAKFIDHELQVSIFLVVAVVLTGAGFGYWMVRRFIISKDGSVDAGIAQFVKWAMRVVAIFFITQVCFFSNT